MRFTPCKAARFQIVENAPFAGFVAHPIARRLYRVRPLRRGLDRDETLPNIVPHLSRSSAAAAQMENRYGRARADDFFETFAPCIGERPQPGEAAPSIVRPRHNAADCMAEKPLLVLERAAVIHVAKVRSHSSAKVMRDRIRRHP